MFAHVGTWAFFSQTSCDILKLLMGKKEIVSEVAWAGDKHYRRKTADMVHSSITDHIDRDGAKCCISNVTYPMLMKLSGQTNSFNTQLCGIVKESGNSFENILKSGVTSRGVGFHKSRIVFLPEHICQTRPLPADKEGGSSHLLQSEISRNCSEVDFCPRTFKQCVFLRGNCFFFMFKLTSFCTYARTEEAYLRKS